MRPDPMTLLAIHNALYMLAMQVASGFAAAYLLRMGFALPVVIGLLVAFYLFRFLLRLLSLPVARRFGFRRTIMLGVGLAALQYIPLSHAQHPAMLLAWLSCVAAGEALYWPTYHACVAVAGDSERRGRQMGLRAALTALSSVLGPATGGFLLAHVGPSADFALGAFVMLLAALPLIGAAEFPAGTVPGLRDSFRGVDRVGLVLFLNDGWMSAGWLSMWQVLYFVLLDFHYETFGLANAAAGLFGLLVSLLGGRWIDRKRHGGWQLAWVSLAMLASILLRAAGSFVPLAGDIANLTGTAVNSAYVPLLMSALYERAKRFNDAYRFHAALEGAWDTGAILGHAVGAAIILAMPQAPTLAVLPAALGVAVFIACMRRDKAQVAAASLNGRA